MAKTETIGLRLEPGAKMALDKAAKDDRRTIASFVEKLIVEHLVETGYLKEDK